MIDEEVTYLRQDIDENLTEIDEELMCRISQ